METVTVQELAKSTEGENGGAIVSFSHQNFKAVSYFIREFSVATPNPSDELAAYRYREYLVVGKRSFLESVWHTLNLSG